MYSFQILDNDLGLNPIFCIQPLDLIGEGTVLSILFISIISHAQTLQPYCKNPQLSELNNQALEAAYNCQPDNYQKLIENGANVLSADCNGSDAIRLSAVGKWQNINAMSDQCSEIAKIIISQNLSIEEQNLLSKSVKSLEKQDEPSWKDNLSEYSRELKEKLNVESLDFGLSAAFQFYRGNTVQDYKSIKNELDIVFDSGLSLLNKYKYSSTKTEESSVSTSELFTQAEYPIGGSKKANAFGEFDYKSTSEGYKKRAYLLGISYKLYKNNTCSVKVQGAPGYKITRADKNSEQTEESILKLASLIGCEFVNDVSWEAKLSHEQGESLGESKAESELNFASLFGIDVLFTAEYIKYSGDESAVPDKDYDSVVGFEFKYSRKIW